MVTRWLIDYQNALDYLLRADNLEFAATLVLEMCAIWNANSRIFRNNSIDVGAQRGVEFVKTFPAMQSCNVTEIILVNLLIIFTHETLNIFWAALEFTLMHVQWSRTTQQLI